METTTKTAFGIKTTMTVLEALRLYPDLFDEKVSMMEYDIEPYPKRVTFQFTGDGNYRTGRINRPILPKS